MLSLSCCAGDGGGGGGVRVMDGWTDGGVRVVGDETYFLARQSEVLQAAGGPGRSLGGWRCKGRGVHPLTSGPLSILE